MTATATEYNERQRYHQKFIALCQETVGACPTGAWRESDEALVKDWQAAQRLTSDGKVGPVTASAIRWASGVMLHPRRFVWWDHGPLERVGAMRSWGVERLAIMLNSSLAKHDTTPQWKYRLDERLLKITDAATARGMAVTLTAWVRPNPAQLDAVLAYWRRMIPLTGADSIEAELEGNWRERNAHGFDSLEEAGAYLVAGMQDLQDEFGVRLIGTTFPGHKELKMDHATALDHLDAASVQIYSRAALERTDDDKRRIQARYRWDADQGPGTWQHRMIPRYRARGYHVICGLAAWAQAFPGHTEREAYERALTAAALEGVEEVGWWSSKHLRPGTAGADFLAALGDADG